MDDDSLSGDADRALALLDALLAAAPIGIAFLDGDLRYLRINPSLAALNGRSVEEHIGRSVAEVLPEVARFLEPLLRRVITTGEPLVNLEAEISPPSTPDEKRNFLATYFPVRQGDVLVGLGGVVMDVTDQKRTADEKARLAAQVDDDRRWVQAILENVPVGVIVAEQESNRILFSNTRASLLLGSSPARIGEADVRDLDGKWLSSAERPLGRALCGESVIAEHVTVPRGPDGGRTLRVHAEPIRESSGRHAAIASLDDVTEIRRAAELQRFLAEASKTLAETLEYDTALEAIARFAVPTMADWCIVDTVEGRACGHEPLVIAHVDPAMVERVRELRRLYPPDANGPRGVSAVLRSGKPELYPSISDEFLAQAAHDERHLALARELGLRSAMIVPLVARGAILGTVTFASSTRSFDENDLAAAEDFAWRAALGLDNARLMHGMRDAVRLREEVLAVVSHDLRNALNTVNVAASLLAQKAADPSVSRSIGTIMRSANRMTHLIASLLDVASIQAGRLRIEKAPHDLAALVRETIEDAEPLATDRKLTLAWNGTPDSVDVSFDRERIAQVLSNLLGNAIKFAHSNSVVTVCVEPVDREVRVSVADRGPGISPDELTHLFQPYWSAARHLKKGTGLGLYIAKSIVHAHGGRIWAESREGVGTTFHFTLPQ